jgi:hypothetical protein
VTQRLDDRQHQKASSSRLAPPTESALGSSHGSRTCIRTGGGTASRCELVYLVTGHYRQAAKLVRDTDTDATLVFYLTKADPLLVLRGPIGPLHRPDHGKVFETPGYHSDLPTGLRNR